ncbi:MAG: 23S rRNA (pseudouridine(1915)-N(3))-methyltransferase RlmH [Verrucomicrobiota bacterium]
MSLKIRICSVGKPRLGYARSGVDEYFGRLKHYQETNWAVVKAGNSMDEGKQLIKSTEGCYRVLLDEVGSQWTSRQLAACLETWELEQQKPIAFIIGGADGHSSEIRKAVDSQWSLGKLTLQHELALVVLLEQLYRAQTIRRGEPYHRD